MTALRKDLKSALPLSDAQMNQRVDMIDLSRLMEVVASVIGITSFGVKLTETLYDFGCNVSSAQEQSSRIASRVDDYITILEILAELLQDESEVVSDKARVMVEKLCDQSDQLFYDIQDLIPRSDSRGKVSWTKKVAWNFRKPKVEMLVGQIEYIKTNVLLLVMTTLVGKRIKRKRRRRTKEEPDYKQDDELQHQTRRARTVIVQHMNAGDNLTALETKLQQADTEATTSSSSTSLVKSSGETAVVLMSRQVEAIGRFSQSMVAIKDASSRQAYVMDRSPELLKSLLEEWTTVITDDNKSGPIDEAAIVEDLPEQAPYAVKNLDSDDRSLNEESNERLDRRQKAEAAWSRASGVVSAGSITKDKGEANRSRHLSNPGHSGSTPVLYVDGERDPVDAGTSPRPLPRSRIPSHSNLKHAEPHATGYGVSSSPHAPESRELSPVPHTGSARKKYVTVDPDSDDNSPPPGTRGYPMRPAPPVSESVDAAPRRPAPPSNAVNEPSRSSAVFSGSNVSGDGRVPPLSSGGSPNGFSFSDPNDIFASFSRAQGGGPKDYSYSDPDDIFASFGRAQGGPPRHGTYEYDDREPVVKPSEGNRKGRKTTAEPQIDARRSSRRSPYREENLRPNAVPTAGGLSGDPDDYYSRQPTPTYSSKPPNSKPADTYDSGHGTSQTPFDKVYALSNVFYNRWFPSAEKFLKSPPSNLTLREKEFKYLSESIMSQVIEAADSIELAGDGEARNHRKFLINQAEELLKKLDDVRQR